MVIHAGVPYVLDRAALTSALEPLTPAEQRLLAGGWRAHLERELRRCR